MIMKSTQTSDIEDMMKELASLLRQDPDMQEELKQLGIKSD